jgi:hypothetical protein
MRAKKPSNSWFQCPRSPRSALIDEGGTRQCPRFRTLDRRKRASDELEDRDSDKQAEIWCLFRQRVDYKLDLNVSLAGLS